MFLAFAVSSDGIFPDKHNSADAKNTENNAKAPDPVNLLTGSFLWDYTDFSLYGENDLDFIRHYKSIYVEENVGFGSGWRSSYSYDMESQDLYIHVTTPEHDNLYFDLDYDGSYKNCGEYSVVWDGSGYTMKDKAGNIYRFSQAGRIQSISYVNGNVVQFGYTGDKLTRVSNDTGSFTFAYNAGGNVERVTDSVGRSVTLSYDGDRLISAENPDGNSLKYAYDANGYLETVSIFKGQLYVQNTYDGEGRVTHQFAKDIGTFDFTYDHDNRHNTCTGTDGYLLEIWYDQLGRITAVNDAEGKQSFVYDNNSLLTSYTDAEGHTFSYTYDGNGNITKTTDALGNESVFAYDANDQLVGAEREEVRLLRLRPHRPPGQCGEAGQEVGAVGGDEFSEGALAPLSPHTLQKRERRLDYELTY